MNLSLKVISNFHKKNKFAKIKKLPLPKSKLLDSRIPVNYRGVSLLSTISKIYTRVLNARIRGHTEDILTDEQNGFRKGRSCVDHTYGLSATVTNAVNDKQSILQHL